MEIIAEKTVITTESHKFSYSFTDLYHDTKSLLKGAMGVTALGIGAAFVASGLPFAILAGGVALYSGGRSLYDAGRELLPLKAQSAISKLFTGREMTEKKPVEAPKSILGKAARVLEFASVTFTGGLAFAAAGFAMGFGGTVAASTAALYLGGGALMIGGLTNLVDQGVKGIIGLVKMDRARKAEKADAPKSTVEPSPEAAPKVGTLSVDNSFNKAVTPAVAAAPQPEAKPVIVPPAPVA